MRLWITATVGCVALFSASGLSAVAPAPVPLTIPVAMLVDAASGRTLFERQPDLRFVPASITKVMTVKVALRLIASGKLNPAQNFTVRPDIARTWSGRGTSLHVKSGQQIPVSILIRAITTVSANDAAAVLASEQAGSFENWAKLMNAEAQRLGMTRSHFSSPNGWPDGRMTYVTARDLVRLGSALIGEHPADYTRYFGQKWLSWNGITGENHDPTIGVVPGADGIKTGFTREAGYNFLGSAQRDGRRLFVVVAGARTAPERAAAAAILLEWGFSAWSERSLFRAGEMIALARIQGGERRGVALAARKPVVVTISPEEQASLKARVDYRGPLMAPIDETTAVAQLIVSSGLRDIGRFPLYPMASVAEAGPVRRWWHGVTSLFA